MKDTPIEFNGPFTLLEEQGQHIIRGADGVRIAELTGQLIDGSVNRSKADYDPVIRSRVARRDEAKFVLDAMNFFYLSLKK